MEMMFWRLILLMIWLDRADMIFRRKPFPVSKPRHDLYPVDVLWEMHLNQIYYYQLAQYISDEIKSSAINGKKFSMWKPSVFFLIIIDMIDMVVVIFRIKDIHIIFLCI